MDLILCSQQILNELLVAANYKITHFNSMAIYNHTSLLYRLDLLISFIHSVATL